MILRITAEELEEKLGAFFGKIAKFFVNIYETIVDALDKVLPHEVTMMVIVLVLVILAVYIFTQKINR